MTLTIDLNEPGPTLCQRARRLVAAGADPSDILHVTRGATKAFEPAPLGAWASLTTSEDADQSIRFRKFRPVSRD